MYVGGLDVLCPKQTDLLKSPVSAGISAGADSGSSLLRPWDVRVLPLLLCWLFVTHVSHLPKASAGSGAGEGGGSRRRGLVLACAGRSRDG